MIPASDNRLRCDMTRGLVCRYNRRSTTLLAVLPIINVVIRLFCHQACSVPVEITSPPLAPHVIRFHSVLSVSRHSKLSLEIVYSVLST